MADDDNRYAIETMASKLAREIARNLIPIGRIQERYHITEDEYQRIVGSNFFRLRLEEELELWNASTPKAIQERISAKSLTMIEESIPEVFELIHDKKQPMSAKIDALKWASSVAGLIKRDSGPADSSERVRFNIYIGDKQQSFDKPIDAPMIEGSSVLVDKEIT
jgi:hypothetical protein